VPTTMRRPKLDPLTLPMIAHRLRATREAVGMSQIELCRRADIKPNAYNQWEKGHGRPSLEHAFRLVHTLSITLDWIYLGDLSGVPHGLASRIVARMPPADSPPK
jgi:transcriptional regulator with XRE-family HTH domain